MWHELSVIDPTLDNIDSLSCFHQGSVSRKGAAILWAKSAILQDFVEYLELNTPPGQWLCVVSFGIQIWIAI